MCPYPDTTLTKETIPDIIIIHFPKYIGPQFFNDEARKNWIPLNPRNMYSQALNSTRTQYPLRFAYAITTTKVQGETLTFGEVNLGDCERSFGQYFVQLSRFKNNH